jgi:D-alanyl-D-alanine carboxypeptidase
LTLRGYAAGMTIAQRAVIMLCVPAWVGFAAAQTPPTTSPNSEVRRHIDAFVAALTSGHPDAFEAMALEHCTPAFRERRTAADRAQLLARLRTDFGTMRVQSIRHTGEGVEVQITGSTSLQGRVMLTLEQQPAGRIDRFGIDVEAGRSPREASSSPPPTLSRDMDDAALAAALDRHLSALSASGDFAGVVLVARGGRTPFVRGYGEADRENHVANAPGTRFNIGSINKSFTTVAITKLIGAGRLKLTDTLGTLLPDHPNADAREATVQQLLEHQGGVADFFGPDFANMPKDTLRSNRDYYRLVASKPLTFAPGTSRRYCNGCFIVLGEIIARVSGLSYEDYILQHVFGPAGMTSAAFLGPEPGRPDVARGYTRRSAAGPDLRPNASMVGARGSAAGGAYATAGDLLAYVQALRGHRLLTAEQTASVASGSFGIAGGAPGLNAVIQADDDTVVIVLANLDPPHAEQLGGAIAKQLSR